MTTLTIFAAVLFTIALIGFIFDLIALILPTVKKALINICALTVIFIDLIKDIARAKIRYNRLKRIKNKLI